MTEADGTKRKSDQPETRDEDAYAEMVGPENFSKQGYEMAVSLGYWG